MQADSIKSINAISMLDMRVWKLYIIVFNNRIFDIMFSIPEWFPPILLSALFLGFYDICKKHAVQENSVMPVLFLATLSGSIFFLMGSLGAGVFVDYAVCTRTQWILILLKSLLVASSWTCVYYAMRALPISIATPIRASSPLWTFIGGLILFREIPSLFQALGMLAIFSGYYLFSVCGKLEGISFSRHRGVHLIMLGTILGAGSALYDKYLLNVLQIPRGTTQFWFSVDLVFILGLAWAFRAFCFGNKTRFKWRWTIPVTGVLLICADFLYFYAVSIPDAHISILSLIRRCNCIVTFAIGAYCFRDVNLKYKASALAVILIGVFILALAG